MAVNMVLRAEEAGLIAPGASLVESTSGMEWSTAPKN